MEQPRWWGDLDVNQHVNNVKYIGWILEVISSGPASFHRIQWPLLWPCGGCCWRDLAGMASKFIKLCILVLV
jgi:hypothetical protein